MNWYKYKVAYIDCDYNEDDDSGITFGEDMESALANLKKDYGEACFGVYLEQLDECYTLSKQDLDVYTKELNQTAFEENKKENTEADTEVNHEAVEEEDDPYDW